MKRILSFLVATLLATAAAPAQGATQKRGESHARKGAAKINMKAARTTALAQVPGGRIKSSELEREGGQLIYSFDIRAGKGIREVHVDAISGKVLEVKDESPSGEARERREERRGHRRRRP
ncbi:MAG: PepSY domain-containing protein [Acidobacteria bacterium]|nr:PepSY domain-containing protein [Acidobacteriota bacterium]